MKRKSMMTTLSPITAETKSKSLEEKMRHIIKYLCFVLAFGICAAYPVNAQRKAAKRDNTVQQSSEFKLEIKRVFRAGDENEGPPRHGDYTVLKNLDNGGTVGSLHLFKPREAVFIIWDGEVIAGPLTTVKQLEGAYAMLSKQSAAEHETRMSIIRNYPTDRKTRVRVYDSKGKLIREQ